MKKYKLLKDLPNIPKGTILEKMDDREYMFLVDGLPTYDAKIVESNPDWFAPIEEFKVGDIVVVENFSPKYSHIPLKITKIETDDNGESFCKFTPSDGEANFSLKIRKVRYATNDEIIQYYEAQGWVKGVKFKWDNSVYDFTYLDFKSNGDCLIMFDNQFGVKIEDCELLKEPGYPKSWEELRPAKGKYISTGSGQIYSTEGITGIAKVWDDKIVFATESQAKSALAFAQLSQIVARMNGDWKPDWGNKKENKYSIVRDCTVKDVLVVAGVNYTFKSLVFPVKDLADFSLEHHNQLWKEYCEL